MVDKANPRGDRLRLALRENLKRRKDQTRERGLIKPNPQDEADERRNSAPINDDHDRKS
jgi:hypothetical protein